jgi:hypothetical protein
VLVFNSSPLTQSGVVENMHVKAQKKDWSETFSKKKAMNVYRSNAERMKSFFPLAQNIFRKDVGDALRRHPDL